MLCLKFIICPLLSRPFGNYIISLSQEYKKCSHWQQSKEIILYQTWRHTKGYWTACARRHWNWVCGWVSCLVGQPSERCSKNFLLMIFGLIYMYQGCVLRKGSPVLWSCEIQGAQHKISMKKLRFSSEQEQTWSARDDEALLEHCPGIIIIDFMECEVCFIRIYMYNCTLIPKLITSNYY